MTDKMPYTDVEELMRLRRWNVTQLAAAINYTENAVRYWKEQDAAPSGPVSMLLRSWLADARAKNGLAK